jgi:hypothetical protein
MLRTTLIRRTLTAAFVLLIAGLAPAAAVIGFCTRMPCCSHGASESLGAPAEDRECCTTITCTLPRSRAPFAIHRRPAKPPAGSRCAPSSSFDPHTLVTFRADGARSSATPSL